jgi:hypothetical protein
MKPVSVDPRAWNIVAGLCVASGCGGRTISSDGSADGSGDGSANGSGTDASESAESSTESNTTLETGGPECVSDVDCQPGYYCLEGECEYTFAPDGHLDNHHYAECYADIDCSALELCDFDYCQQVLSPSDCQPPDPVPELSIPIGSLALHFADVDADGAEELVVATASELQVYESGSDMPSISPRGLDSDSIDAMVGGSFDAMPGDDVMILFADELRLHRSDGVGNFVDPSVSPSAWPDSVGLLDGEFDGAAPADLLVWASSGAGVLLGSGDGVPLSAEVIGSATARSLDDPLGGFVLQHNAFLDFYTAAGEEIGSSQMRGSNVYALTSIAQLGDGFDLSSSSMPGQWTLIEQWGPATGNLGIYWGLLGQVEAMAGGDFDGDARADIALIVDGTLQIQFGVLTDSSCLASYPFAGIAEDLAVGDHDGDGDDELGVRFDAGNIAVVDGE